MHVSTRTTCLILSRVSSLVNCSQYARPLSTYLFRHPRFDSRHFSFGQFLRFPVSENCKNLRLISTTCSQNTKKCSSKDNRSTAQIQNIALLHETAMLEVVWSDGGTDTYPYLWLRDNCQCSSCYETSSGSRLFLTKDLHLDAQPIHAQVSQCGSHIDMEWAEGHKSVFLSNWLFDRAFNSERQIQRYNGTLRLPHVYWGSELLDDLPTASLEEVLASDKALLKWLTQLEVTGLTVMIDCGTEAGQIERLCQRVEKIRVTHYGHTFSVRVKPDPNNAAYNSGNFQLHLDQPYYFHTPGIQMLHCLKQASLGGESQFVDGIQVAHKMKMESPQLFQVLKDIVVDFWDVGRDELGNFNKISQQPTIRVNHRGDIIGVHFNNAVRDTFMAGSAQEVQLWYQAYKFYHSKLYSPENLISWKMTPGTMVIIDNNRVLHGRSAFPESEERELEGGYLDWDEVRSKRRVLNNKFNGVKHESTCEE